ncbi:hypothetical protein QH494_14410 [Sphingomonas sp. AR_OL41]|jgi:hypothetical protein|uniref:hypothetical protein n=1 Tax=Sphingomonas sp. AR_OL41 TaxID=3042729 RepID=UPI0024811DDA|nr:hypothetical protein [Sphingomonas sp. AR_OL41]MDH7973379.1 hypothetical protein [Sphingomonas sp. AR_OL41]
MNSIVKKIGLGAVLAATTLGAAVPADAQRWRGGYRHHGDGDAAGAALIGGIAGLAIGAAIASGSNRDREVYYRDRGYRPDYDGYYYRSHGYYPNDGYYAYNYRRNGYYDRRCWIENRYDRYYDRYMRVRVCD